MVTDRIDAYLTVKIFERTQDVRHTHEVVPSAELVRNKNGDIEKKRRVDVTPVREPRSALSRRRQLR